MSNHFRTGEYVQILSTFKTQTSIEQFETASG